MLSQSDQLEKKLELNCQLEITLFLELTTSWHLQNIIFSQTYLVYAVPILSWQDNESYTHYSINSNDGNQQMDQYAFARNPDYISTLTSITESNNSSLVLYDDEFFREAIHGMDRNYQQSSVEPETQQGRMQLPSSQYTTDFLDIRPRSRSLCSRGAPTSGSHPLTSGFQRTMSTMSSTPVRISQSRSLSHVSDTDYVTSPQGNIQSNDFGRNNPVGQNSYAARNLLSSQEVTVDNIPPPRLTFANHIPQSIQGTSCISREDFACQFAFDDGRNQNMHSTFLEETSNSTVTNAAGNSRNAEQIPQTLSQLGGISNVETLEFPEDALFSDPENKSSKAMNVVRYQQDDRHYYQTSFKRRGLSSGQLHDRLANIPDHNFKPTRPPEDMNMESSEQALQVQNGQDLTDQLLNRGFTIVQVNFAIEYILAGRDDHNYTIDNIIDIISRMQSSDSENENDTY